MTDTAASKNLPLSKRRRNDLVLVSGAAGFVGSWLAEALCDLGISTLGLDSLRHGSSIGREKNLSRLKTLDNFEFIETDVVADFPATLRRKKITHIIDVTDVFPSLGSAQLRLDELLTSSYGLKNLLDLTNHHGARLVYTSSAFVYQGLASHESLQNYYDGAELSSFYTYLEAKRYGEVLCHEYVERYGVDARIARFTEIYGPRMSLSANSTFTRLIQLAITGKDLIVDEEGSQKHPLLYIDDAVYGLIKLLFAEDEHARAGIFYFTNPEPVSTLSISYTLRELVDPARKVDFEPRHRKIDLPNLDEIDISRSERLLKWDPQINLTTGLKKTLASFNREPTPAEQIEPAHQPTVDAAANPADADKLPPAPATDDDPPSQDRPARSLRGWLAQQSPSSQSSIEGLTKSKFWHLRPIEILLSLVLIGLVFALPFLISAGLTLRATWAARGLNFNRATQFSQQALVFYEFYKAPAFVAGLGDAYLNLEHTLRAIVYGSRTLESGAKLATQLAPIWAGLDQSLRQEVSAATGPSPDPGTNVIMTDESLPSTLNHRAQLDQARVYLPNLQTDYALLQNEVTQINPAALVPPLRESIRELRDYTRIFAPLVTNLGALMEQAPFLLGDTSPQRYIVWLQNSTEIRSTGGFIGSYAAITLDQGRVTDFKVDDIYNPDGLLQPHTDPALPEPIRKYMQVEYLGLRDSNWWPEFPESAHTFVQLYERATGEKLAGVVTTNLDLVKKLLALTGPVQLTAYNEKITAENVFERAQFHSEVGFEPGSTQKKDFLGQLANALLEKFLTNQDKFAQNFGRLLAQGLAARDIMVYSTNINLQTVLEDSALAGQSSYQAQSGHRAQFDQLSDYLRVIDSNVGGNKANFWVNRTSEYSVDVDRDGRLRGTLEITWVHTGTNATWPNGDYQNYVRFYLPPDIDNLQIDPPLTDQQIVDESGYKSVQGLAEVPIDTVKKITVSYQLPGRLALTNQNPYTLTWENQPGLEEKIEFQFNLPTFLSSPSLTHWQQTLQHPTQFQVSVTGTEAFE